MIHQPAKFERVGFDRSAGRALFVASVGQPEEVKEVILAKNRYFAGYFVALIACDAQAHSVAAIARFARLLIDAGCVYFCCWGPGCEQVHDIIDEEYARDSVAIHDDASTIMTTWHTKETLEEAAWFAINVAFPDDRFFDTCKSVVAFSIGSEAWKRQLAAALSDPRALTTSDGNAA